MTVKRSDQSKCAGSTCNFIKFIFYHSYCEITFQAYALLMVFVFYCIDSVVVEDVEFLPGILSTIMEMCKLNLIVIFFRIQMSVKKSKT